MFTAKTTVTRFCSGYCSKRAYKDRKRKEKIEASESETQAKVNEPITTIQGKEFLSVTDLCKLFSIGQTTVWRLAKSGRIKSAKIGKKRFFRRADIDKLFEQ